MKRWPWLLIFLSFIAVVAVAFRLNPNPAGIGTHRALGLPDCLFHYLTRLPCPSCGLTTSFVHLVHGNILASFRVHPLGPLLFALYALLSGFSLLEFFGKPTALNRFLNGAYSRWVYGALGLYLGIWLTRLLTIKIA